MVSNQGPSTYQPNTLQLGQTGSQRMNVSAFFCLCVSISKAPTLLRENLESLKSSRIMDTAENRLCDSVFMCVHIIIINYI